jgi:hypothetical protein
MTNPCHSEQSEETLFVRQSQTQKKLSNERP